MPLFTGAQHFVSLLALGNANGLEKHSPINLVNSDLTKSLLSVFSLDCFNLKSQKMSAELQRGYDASGRVSKTHILNFSRNEFCETLLERLRFAGVSTNSEALSKCSARLASGKARKKVSTVS